MGAVVTVVVIVNPYDRPRGTFAWRRWIPVGQRFKPSPNSCITPQIDMALGAGHDVLMVTVEHSGRCSLYQMPPGMSLNFDGAVVMPRAVEYDLRGRALRVLFECATRGDQYRFA